VTLICRQLCKTYRRARTAPIAALRGVDLQVAAGQLALVQGPSGAGKTTLLAILAGLLDADSGSVTCGEVEVSALTPAARAAWRRRHVGFVLQTFPLTPYLTCLENVLLASRLAGRPPAEARAILERLQMGHRLDHLPERLSVGERQRTAVARALVCRPLIVAADEPTANLDAENEALVVGELLRHRDEGGIVVVATHSRAVGAEGDVRLTLERPPS
jgi:putative ABC transport system ATP-binding protein